MLCNGERVTAILDPQIARRTWMTLEPIHGMVYFSPHGAPIYEAIGLTGRQPYFASRAAAMGVVSAQMVTATFFNFAPAAVASAVPSAWSVATPADIVGARLRVVPRASGQGAEPRVHHAR